MVRIHLAPHLSRSILRLFGEWLEKRACAMAFTYNDPVVFIEYAIDVAQACRAKGVKTIAVSA
jgi:hypothetical protein